MSQCIGDARGWLRDRPRRIGSVRAATVGGNPVTSGRGEVTVSVDADGHVRTLRIDERAMNRSATELSALVAEMIRQARFSR